MYGLFGLDHNIQSVYRLAAPYVQGDVETMQDLQPAYRSFLGNLHKGYPINSGGDPIVNDGKTAQALISSFGASKINDLVQEQMVAQIYSGSELENKALTVRNHFGHLKEINPELSELFHLCIHGIVLAGAGSNQEGYSAHGGSTNLCIGLIWLSLKDHLSTQDILEMLIHELTHTLVFIDELNYEHFNYPEMTKSKNWAQSSILRRPRPMDKVLHSIVVSSEIIFARKNFLPNIDKLHVHPPTEILRQATMTAIESVLAHPQLNVICKPRAVQLVETAKTYLQSL